MKTQGSNRNQGQSQPQQALDQQVFNIEQHGSSQQGQQMPEAVPNNAPHKQYEGKNYNQGKKCNKK